MESRQENGMDLGIVQSEIGMEEFEQIINETDNIYGLNYINGKGQTTIKTPEEIEEELQIDDVDCFYYIQQENNMNEIKILFNNGDVNIIYSL